MLEIDTIPVISNTAKKTTNAHTPESGTVINKTPREVATAFPPLNFI